MLKSSVLFFYILHRYSDTSVRECQGRSCTILADVWVYDMASRGWEEAIIDGPAKSPAARAGHALVSSGSRGLMCGGVVANASQANDILECWWLSPVPRIRWDPLPLVTQDAPCARSSHSLVFDSDLGNILLFGGLDAEGRLLDDCWWLSVPRSTLNNSAADYAWHPCNASGLRPSPRYGHGAVYLRGSMYLMGGFASDGLLGTVPLGDLWTLTGYDTIAAWSELMPASVSLTPRAFFAFWTSGFHIMVHGGEGAGGLGPASVFLDTWQFNTYTGEWYLFRTSDTVPVASHLSVASSDGTTAVSFGGKSKDGLAMGKLFTFNRVSGWSQGGLSISFSAFLRLL
jgi:hypothetical protein